MRVELRLQRLAALLGFGVELVADFGTDCLRAIAGVCQRLFIRRECCFRVFLRALRLREIALDALFAFFEDTADARDRDPRDQQVERDEGDHQPDDLGRERFFLERRKTLAVLARRDVLDRRNRLR